jgi:hypothetical protein
MSFGGSQDEDNVWWWFFEGFEQGIGGAITQHMDFVNDVNLVAGLVGGIVDLLTQAPNIINAGIAGGINFDNVQGSGLAYCLAHGAAIARFTITIAKAVYCLGQNTRRARLTGSSWTTEEIGVRYVATTQRVA